MSARPRRGGPTVPDPLAGLSDAALKEAAHRAIVEETALRAAPTLHGTHSQVRNLARAAHGLAQLASGSTGTLYNGAAGGVMDCQVKAAQTPSGCTDDVAAKLALLVSNLGRSLPPGAVEYRLAVSALLDVVLLRGGEATLPPGALDPVVDRIDAERWCRRAEALQ